jgi:hypothetical protein
MEAATLLVYLPHWNEMAVIYRYWDGPHYMYLAKTLYQVPADHPFQPYNLPPAYFATHLPAYPLLIRAVAVVTRSGYPVAMVLATLISSVAAALLFFRVLKAWNLVASPLWTTLLFCFLPPRWLIYHAVGATEPLFFCFVFGAFLALRAERTAAVVVCILLASLTRITGLLLIPAFGLDYLRRGQWRKLAALPLGALGVLGLFTFYHYTYGDFFAYFSWNVDQAQLINPRPLEVFRTYASGADFHSTEFYLGTYLLYGLGTLALWEQRAFFFYALLFFLFNGFVFHIDLSRYFLATAPFALLVGFDSILSRWACRLMLPLILYLTYTYAWGFLPHNLVAPFVYEGLLRDLARP